MMFLDASLFGSTEKKERRGSLWKSFSGSVCSRLFNTFASPAFTCDNSRTIVRRHTQNTHTHSLTDPDGETPGYSSGYSRTLPPGQPQAPHRRCRRSYGLLSELSNTCRHHSARKCEPDAETRRERHRATGKGARGLRAREARKSTCSLDHKLCLQ